MDFTLVFAAAAAVNRFVAFVKIYVDQLGLENKTRDAVLVLIAVIAGILVSLISNNAVNIFTNVPALPPLGGQILTGVLAGLGADVLNGVLGLLYWQTPPAQK